MSVLSRRAFTYGLVASAVAGRSGLSQGLILQTPPLPRPDAFNSGDFLWPKKPGVFVPYSQQANIGPERDAEIWEREKQEFLDQARSGQTGLSPEQLQELRGLTYREFLARYEGDQKPGQPGVYSSGGGLYVGHVGIIDINPNGEPEVIEALWGPGVTRRTYKDWLSGRPDEVVWLGRLRDQSKSARASISGEAAKYVGRPYKFWNFNLNDDSGFYCSKLVWLSVYRSLGFAIDGNFDPKRDFWFSPKQLLYLPVIDRLHDPGPYATR